jgi:hypothetical protein
MEVVVVRQTKPLRRLAAVVGVPAAGEGLAGWEEQEVLAAGGAQVPKRLGLEVPGVLELEAGVGTLVLM